MWQVETVLDSSSWDLKEKNISLTWNISLYKWNVNFNLFLSIY